MRAGAVAARLRTGSHMHIASYIRVQLSIYVHRHPCCMKIMISIPDKQLIHCKTIEDECLNVGFLKCVKITSLSRV